MSRAFPFTLVEYNLGAKIEMTFIELVQCVTSRPSEHCHYFLVLFVCLFVCASCNKNYNSIVVRLSKVK